MNSANENRKSTGDAELTVSTFLGRLLCVTVFPTVLAVGLMACLMLRLGGGLSATAIARMQGDDRELAWVGPLQFYSGIKMARLKLIEPEVVVIGASRVGQIRSAMFRPYRFYNASMVGWGLERLYRVLDEISLNTPPKVVIMSIDYFMFSSGYEAQWRYTEDKMPLDFGMNEVISVGVKSLGRSILKAPYSAAAITFERLRNGPIDAPDAQLDGLRMFGQFTDSALTVFRYDGSMRYFPTYLSKGEDLRKHIETVLSLVATGTGAGIDPKQMAAMNRIADLARSRGIVLVGVQMPLSRAAVKVLDGNADYLAGETNFPARDRGVWRDFESEQMRKTLKGMGIEFFDCARHPEINDLHQFVDNAHSGEYLALACVIDVLKSPNLRNLLPRIDVDSLLIAKDKALEDRNYFEVFRNEF